MQSERSRVHHPDVAARGRRNDAARSGGQLSLSRKCRQKNVEIGGIFGDQHDAGDSSDGVGVLLQRRGPEILRKVLLAHRKADFGRMGIPRERERKSNLHPAAVRSRSFALEMERIGNGNSPGTELGRVGASITAFQHQERKPLLTFEKQPVKRAEKRRDRLASKLLQLDHRQQFEKTSWKLYNVIVRAPGMAVARPDGETQPPIEIGSRIEVAHRVNDVVEAARQRFTLRRGRP